MPKLLGLGRIERLARHVAVSGRVDFWVEIAQPHIDAKVR
jgi:hypothetical protein